MSQVLDDARFYGAVLLAADPTLPLQASTKQYTDAADALAAKLADNQTFTGLNTFTKNITLDATGTASIILDRNAASNYAMFEYRTNGTQMWVVGTRNGEGENFVVLRSAGGLRALTFDGITALGTVLADPTAPLGIATKQYVDNRPKSATGQWTYDSGTSAADPGTGDVATNTASITTSTAVYISRYSQNNVDNAFVLAQLTTGDTIAVQQTDDASHWARLVVTGPVTNSTSWFTIPVSYVAGSSTEVAKSTVLLLQFGYGSGVVGIDQATGDARYVNTAGDTMSGTLSVDGGLNLNAAAGTGRSMTFQSGWATRWAMGRNSTAESGSNAGSDFSIGRYSDAGAWIADALSIQRSTGNVFVFGQLNVQGVVLGDSATFGTAYEGFETPTSAFVAGNGSDKSLYLIAKDSVSGVILRAGNDPAKQLQVKVDSVVSALPMDVQGSLTADWMQAQGGLDLNSNRITGVALPTDAADAANKSYVDSKVATPPNEVAISTTQPTDPAVELWVDPNGTWATEFATKAYVDGSGWTALPLQNGWVDYGPPFSPPRYRKVGPMVTVQGLVASGTVGSIIATLPAGYRPGEQLILATVTNSNVIGRLDVLTSGGLQCNNGSNSWFSICCTFFAE